MTTALLFSACVPFYAVEIVANEVMDFAKTAQPVQVVDRSGRVIAGPADVSSAAASFRISSTTIKCMVDEENFSFWDNEHEPLTCNNGWSAQLNVLGYGVRFKSPGLRLRRDVNGQVEEFFCVGSFEGDFRKGIVAPFGMECSSGGSHYGFDGRRFQSCTSFGTDDRQRFARTCDENGFGVGHAFATSETTHSYLFWVNPPP